MEQKFNLGESVVSKTSYTSMIIVEDKLGEDKNGFQVFNGSYECAWYDKNHDVRFEILPEGDLSRTRELFKYH